MNAEELEQFRAMLLQLKKKLTKNIDYLQNDALKSAGDRVDELSDISAEHMADRGSDNFAMDLMIRVLENSDAEVCDINLALERIDDGSYGKCEGCGEAIGRDRLEALPFARLCIGCKHRQEQGLHEQV